MLRYLTAGESHGPALVALIDGFPAGLTVDTAALDHELVRRQGGYGRGGRQRIETDSATFLSGLWRGVTLGSPLALEVVNRDAKLERLEDVDRPRPGHADLAGAVKHLGGVRSVLERASTVKPRPVLLPVRSRDRCSPCLASMLPAGLCRWAMWNLATAMAH